MAAGSIVVDLLLRTGSFESDSNRAAKTAKKNAKEMSDAFKAMGITVAAAFVATAGALALLTKNAIDGIDALNDVADATGASIENISALEQVALQTGTTLDNVSGILVKFNNVLKEAEPDSPMAKALEAIGLSAEELRQLDPAEALRVTAAALSQFADDGNKARITQDLFGKSIKDAAPFLKDLAEQTRLVGVTTKEQAQAAEDFNKSIFAIQASVTLLAREFAVGFLPVLQDTTDAIRAFSKDEDAVAGATSSLNTVLNVTVGIFKGIVVVGANVAYVFEGIGREIGAMAAQLAALARFDFKAFNAISDAVKEDAAKARKEIDAFNAKLLGRTEAALGTKPAAVTDTRPSIAGLPTDKQVEKTAKALKGLTDQQKADAKLIEEAWSYVISSQEEYLENQQRILLDQQKSADAYRDLIDPTRALSREIQTIQALVEAGALTPDEGLSVEIKKLSDFYGQAEEQLSTFEEFTKSAAKNMQTAFADFLFDPFKEGTDGMHKSFGTMIQRMVAEAVAADLMNRLLASSKAASGSGDFFGGLLGAFGSIFGGAREAGGPVTAGKAYLVGERRPELFVPNTSGTIIPDVGMAANSAGSGGPITLNVNVAAGTPEQVRRSAAAGAREALSALSNAQRYA